MMNQIYISNLNEVKSVFNSYSDNVQFYKVLRNGGVHSIKNVELAQPNVREVNMTIIWKAETQANLRPYPELSFEEKNSVAADLKQFFSSFKKEVDSYKNTPAGFANKIIQIPDLNSIYYDEKTSHIVIVNWGFLEDTFNPKEGIIETLIPKRSSSILIRLVDKNNSPVENFSLKFSGQGKNHESITNENGFARFGALPKGESFTVESNQDPSRSFIKEFICDGRKEYLIEVEAEEDLSGLAEDLGISESIDIEEDELDEVPEDKGFPVILKFVNAFNKPIKHKEINIIDDQGVSSKFTTNEQGQIAINTESKSIDYSLTRRGADWKESIDVRTEKHHIIQLKPIYPWLWWLLILILAILLFCCLFLNCFCEESKHTKRTPVENVTKVEEIRAPKVEHPEEIIKPCNSENRSGGEGITQNIHTLGEQSGTVQIAYDMQHIPDKLEVFYENNLVASTEEIVGNEKGFVGGALNSGCCGVLSFSYTKNDDDFCKVVITGLDQTEWNYSISCPN